VAYAVMGSAQDSSAPIISAFLALEAQQHLSDEPQTGVVVAAVGRVAEKVTRELADSLTHRGLLVAGIKASPDPNDLLSDPTWHLAAVVSPYKLDIAAACTRLGPRAMQTQVVDTLVRRSGEVIGLNVNSFAMQAACTPWSRVSPPRIVVVGTGATARSAVVGLAAVWPHADIGVTGRGPSRAASLVQHVGMGRVIEDIEQFSPVLVVHTTTVGECDDRQTLEIPMELTPEMVVLDLNSRLTAFQRQALAAGCLTMGGAYVQVLTNLMRGALFSQAG
jgi:shikimate dehydrogenase